MRGILATLKRLRGHDGGVAGVEFALWTTAFFFLIMVAIDFGSFYIERGKMNEAVNGAAVASFAKADNVDFSALPDYVRGLANDQSIAVTTSCNGSADSCTNLNRSCACLKSDGSYTAASCGNLCVGTNMTAGSTAGYYLTITATQSFNPVMVPRGVLDNASLTQHATVRLQ